MKFYVRQSVLWLIFPFYVFAQTNTSTDKMYYRDFTVIYAVNHDILNSSENWRTGLKLFNDAFHRVLAPKIKNRFLRNTTDALWTTAVKWSAILWPHEFGHIIRTNQFGGKFRFEKLAFPGIISSLELPENPPTEHRQFALIGGFEANHLSARDIQLDFYKHDGLYNDEYGMAFGHRILYPLYQYVFEPQNPNNKTTWIEQNGDPVNFAHLTWQRGGNSIFEPDSTISSELIRFYNQAGLASLVWNIIDINIYRQAGAFFGNQLKGKRPSYLGNENFKWSYSTLFNTSVLGAELYLFNYFKIKDQLFVFYLKNGFPYQNQGIGIYFPYVIKSKYFSLDLNADFWRQEFYGNGLGVTSNFRYDFDKKLGLATQIGYKTRGYLLGRMIQEGLIGYLGVRYQLHSSNDL